METTTRRSLAHVRGRDFLDDQAGWSREELLSLLDLASRLKLMRERHRYTPFLPGRHLGMIFEEPSTRTRVSFEAGMSELGGDALYLRPGEIHLPGRETVADTARTLSRFVDAIEARLLHHDVLLELAAFATVPVINGLTDVDHPVQTMSDALTIFEEAGRFEGVKVAFLGDATNVCTSLVATMTKLGADISVANPPRYRLPREWEELGRRNAVDSGSSLVVTADPLEALDGADFVYTDLWWWVGQEAEAEERTEAMRPYQVNADLMKGAKKTARFMHCLPAARGLEVTDEVIDGPASLVWEQAENRLHFEKALLLALIGLDQPPDDPDLFDIAQVLLSRG
jgi:ornithine carbamoyltransferase